MKRAPSLRPPTLMIDLLFGALMLFAFHMGDPTNRTVVPRDIDLPTAAKGGEDKPVEVVAIQPRRGDGGGLAYELPDGTRLDAKGIAEQVRKNRQVPVLLLPRDASVQAYVEAEQPLRKLGVKVGLAVELEKEKK